MSRRRKQIEEIEHNDRSYAGKKNIAVLLALIVILAGIGGASAYWLMSQHSGSGGWSEESTGGGSAPASGSSETPETVINGQLSVKYAPISSISKKVIGETFVQTGCGACPYAENDLKYLESERSDFYFVSLVIDTPLQNTVIARYKEIFHTTTGLVTPYTVFDGGYEKIRGAGSIDNYTTSIEACKDAPVIPVEIEGDVVSESGSSATISLSVIVSDKDFNGSVKAFVIDKNSSWKNTEGKSIPNAFVGYLFNEPISLNGRSLDKTGEWKMGHVKSFSELEIIVAVYDSNGHGVQAYRMAVQQ